jgi:hypothetical protein
MSIQWFDSFVKLKYASGPVLEEDRALVSEGPIATGLPGCAIGQMHAGNILYALETMIRSG